MPLKFSPYAAYAFESLYCRLHKIKSGSISLSKFKEAAGITNPDKVEQYPLFVTWNIDYSDGQGADQDESDKELRGCIGTFSDVELNDGIKSYSLISAFEDTRFNPIDVSELPSLSCSVTLLKNFQEAKDPLDWELGKNGIRISFVKNRRYSATFLPDVAVEQGWDKNQTLTHLVRKAGLSSGQRWSDLDLKVTKYEGEKGSINYNDFLKLRKDILGK